MSRKIPYSLHLNPGQIDKLKALRMRTRITVSELVRGAIDEMLAKEDSNGQKEILGSIK
ncbi:hypothetical protein LCGC14_1526080 [marine sediment metagenome]|uniref:Predicted DNA-binding protein ribbon-helix-helix domain-containing protein n=1 Tax=marine sediment metagenome TaxID=412755 RepID=A0A0F9IXI6_9ZZZZ